MKKTNEELQNLIIKAQDQIEIGKKCTHYKNSNKTYTIIDLVIIEKTEEIGVVYKADYSGIKFIRPLKEFFEEVKPEQKRFNIL